VYNEIDYYGGNKKITIPQFDYRASELKAQAMVKTSELMTIKQASDWVSQYLRKDVTPSNISYLIQYGRIKKVANNGVTLVSKEDLVNYYSSYIRKRETKWISTQGKDLNWSLSFDYLKEAERTKHVHRLHPYKGKFIPQLVEYFLDSHTDVFKKEVYFKSGDIILDPFAGSGTTLVQANELGMHAVGIDVSSFNTLISNAKTIKYNLIELYNEARRITVALRHFISSSKSVEFQEKLDIALTEFNNKYFPSPDFKLKVISNQINEQEYGKTKEKEFEQIFKSLVTYYHVEIRQASNETFLDKWYVKHVREEIDLVRSLIEQIQDFTIKNALIITLSRTIRSCRATTHYDLATLKEPVFSTYYCHKHGKICKPLFSILNWWTRYCEDMIQRLDRFNKLRTKTHQFCLTGDSRTIDVIGELSIYHPALSQLVKDKKFKGIFSSPPYVGLIDYHDQHAYAYDLFQFGRKDHLEIGAMSKGQGLEARMEYIQSIVDVLNNCKRFLASYFDIFLVANDKYEIYPIIAEKSNMTIVNKFKRPVLCRVERDKGAYSETIFHMKAK
jgi:hypothetical protein